MTEPFEVQDIVQAHELLGRIATEIKSYIVGQDELIDLIVVIFLAKEGILIKGAPGIAKSSAARFFAKKSGLKFFKYQMHRDTRDSELVGPQSVKAMKEDRLVYVLDKICRCEVAVIDEFNKSRKVLAVLRQVLEERSFQEEKIPLWCYIATMNPSDEEQIDPADLDRFIISYEMQGVLERAGKRATEDNEKKVKALLAMNEYADPMDLIKPEDPVQVKALLKLVPHIIIPENVTNCLDWLFIEIQSNATKPISDRAVRKVKKLLQAHALYSGRSRVTTNDISAIVPHIFAHRLEGAIEPNLTESIIEIATKVADLASEPNPAVFNRMKEEIGTRFQNYRTSGTRTVAVANDDFLYRVFSNVCDDRRKEFQQLQQQQPQAANIPPIDFTESDVAWNQIQQAITQYRTTRGDKTALEANLDKLTTFVFVIPNERLGNVPQELRQLLMNVRDSIQSEYEGWMVSGENTAVSGRGAVKATFHLIYKRKELGSTQANFKALHQELLRISKKETGVTLA